LTAIWAVFARERGLTMVGVAGVVLASLCLIAVAVRGRFIPPEGKMLDAATFCFGVGVFTLTVALLLPSAGFTPTGRRRWRRGFYVFAVYGLAVESIQAFRGLDPRFTEAGGSIDVIAGDHLRAHRALEHRVVRDPRAAVLPLRRVGRSARVAPRDPLRRHRRHAVVRRSASS
jgi:hypothetical protein